MGAMRGGNGGERRRGGRAGLRRRTLWGTFELGFGRGEGGEGLLEAGEGQAEDVEVAAFDAGDVAAGAALDGVGAGLIVGFAGREVAKDFFSGERGKMHQRGLDEGEALAV